MALKGEGDKFKLVSVSEHVEVVARCGSVDGAATGSGQRKQN